MLRPLAPVLLAIAAAALLALIAIDPYVPVASAGPASGEWELGDKWRYPLDNAHEFLKDRGPWGELELDDEGAGGANGTDAGVAASAEAKVVWRLVGISRRQQGPGKAHFFSDVGDSTLVPLGEPAPGGGDIVAMGRDWVELTLDGERVRLELFQPIEGSSPMSLLSPDPVPVKRVPRKRAPPRPARRSRS